MGAWLPRLTIHDPHHASLRNAVRAAIVIPAVFAIANRVIGDPQVALFGAFGSFALLVFVDFGGSKRSRFLAFAALTVVGLVNIVLGTAVSGNAWLAAGTMAAVGFAVLFSGLINGYFAAAATAALLTFILAATIHAPFSAVGSRLEGWSLAAGASVAAQLLLWPAPRQAALRDQAGRACHAMAGLARALLDGVPQAVADATRAAGAAVAELQRAYLAAPHGPTGPADPQAALGSLADELTWLVPFLAPYGRPPGLDVTTRESGDALAAVADALGAAGDLVDGKHTDVDVQRLRDSRMALVVATVQRIPELPAVPDDEALLATVEPAFRLRIMSIGAEEIVKDAATVAGAPRVFALRETLRTTEELAVEHASARSVWFQNSVRGAAGLALAVYIAQRSGVQHSFWVVLGTLSVLRSNALGTGWSIVSALAGTAAGIVLGAALVLAIGAHHAAYWAVLPLAVLFASYAPRAISFAAGQAAFTVSLFVLFNLLQPTGWRVGLVRIEDAAIGFAISLGVGLLFWPRGAAAMLRETLAYAYARDADYVVAAERSVVDGASSPAQAEQAAVSAEHRLDDAYRQYLTERSPQSANRESIAALVAGASRVRRAAQSLSALAVSPDGAPLDGCGANLDGEVNALRAWYVTLGDSLARSTSVPPPHIRDDEGRRRLLECARRGIASGEKAQLRAALNLVWASQHLDVLWQLEQHLGRHAAAVDS